MAARRGDAAAAARLLLKLACVVVATLAVTVVREADGHTAAYKLARLTPDEAFVEESTDEYGVTTVRLSNGLWILTAREDKHERVRYSCDISYSLRKIIDFVGRSTVKRVEIGALGLREIEINCLEFGAIDDPDYEGTVNGRRDVN